MFILFINPHTRTQAVYTIQLKTSGHIWQRTSTPTAKCHSHIHNSTPFLRAQQDLRTLQKSSRLMRCNVLHLKKRVKCQHRQVRLVGIRIRAGKEGTQLPCQGSLSCYHTTIMHGCAQVPRSPKGCNKGIKQQSSRQIKKVKIGTSIERRRERAEEKESP